MNKNLIALAVATLAAAPALAAKFEPVKGTTFEVNVEVGAMQQAIKNSNGINKKELNGSSLNQIEIKGTQVINSDVSVFGEIEVDYDPIKDNGSLATDDARFGIASKRFGRFSVGQFDSYFEDNVVEALAVNNGDKALVTEPVSNNDGRHLQYINSFGGLTLAIDYLMSSNANVATSEVTKNGHAVTLAYKLGDLTLAAGQSKVAGFRADTSAALVTAGKAKEVTGLSAKYRLGNATLIAMTATEDLEASALKNKYNGVAATYKFGDFTVGGAYQRAKEGSAANRTETALNFGYSPFKNTTFFLDTAKFKKAQGQGDVTEIGVKYAF